VIAIELTGHLTRASLAASLAQPRAALAAAAGAHVRIDCRTMTGYDADARADFVEFMRASRAKVARVAIVTERVSWRMVISAMSLASGVSMKPFTSLAEADAWLASS
jgi:hypothetical protein